MITLLDTGPLVAAWDRTDANHAQCAELIGTLAGTRGRLALSAPVAVEVCWLLERNLNPRSEADFLETLLTGEIDLVELTLGDLTRMAELVRQYEGFRSGPSTHR